MITNSFAKILTKNDIGKTGAHQAGMHIPKKNEELMREHKYLKEKLELLIEYRAKKKSNKNQRLARRNKNARKNYKQMDTKESKL